MRIAYRSCLGTGECATVSSADLHESITSLQVKHGVVQCVHAELHDLYRWLEEEFHPLKLAERTAAPVAFMAEKKDLKQYVPAIQDITIIVKPGQQSRD